jgi:hypothetical protein
VRHLAQHPATVATDRPLQFLEYLQLMLEVVEAVVVAQLAAQVVAVTVVQIHHLALLVIPQGRSILGVVAVATTCKPKPVALE